ncbi:MAG: JmjC domain-containing protein [Arenimonas sp.]
MIEATSSSKHFLGIPTADFMRDYWQRKPLLIRQAFPKFEAPLTPEDLAGIACEQGVLARLIEHDTKKDAWKVSTGPFAETLFPKLGKTDWTLLVQDMDKWDDDVAALLERFDFLPRWRLDDVMISFAAPGGSVGAHVDQYDVFLLQGLGRRRWQIDARADAPREFRDDVELKLLREFTPSHEWVLEPGDMLYLPPGVPHHGIAEDACLTFSVGMRAPAHAELLSAWADEALQQLPEDLRYQDAGMAAPADPGEIDATAAARVLEVFRLHVPTTDAEAAAFFGRFITSYRNAVDIAAPPRPPTAAQMEAKLEKGAILNPHPFARWAWHRHGSRAIVHVNGDSFEAATPLASRLAAATPLGVADFRLLDSAGRGLLHTLLERGYLVLGPAPRKR